MRNNLNTSKNGKKELGSGGNFTPISVSKNLIDETKFSPMKIRQDFIKKFAGGKFSTF